MVKKKNKQSSPVARSVGQSHQADGLSIENSLRAHGDENIGGLPEQDVSPDSGLVKWQMFIKVVHAHIDPVLASMLFETDFIKFDHAKKIVHLVTLKKFTMFQDLFIEQRTNYQEYLDRIFGFKTVLVVEFVKISEKKKMDEQKKETSGSVVQMHSTQVTSSNAIGSAQSRRQATGQRTYDRAAASSRNVGDRSVSVSVGRNEKNIDITDEKKWKLTHKLLEHFGGTVREIIKDSNEFDA